MLATFASILDFFQYAFKDIISRASSFDVSVHFFHKSSCAISIRLDVLNKFYKITFVSLIFLFASLFSYVFSCCCIVTFVDCAHWHDFTPQKDN